MRTRKRTCASSRARCCRYCKTTTPSLRQRRARSKAPPHPICSPRREKKFQVRRLTAGLEKVAQQFAGAQLLDAAVNFRPVMRGRLVEQAGAVLDGAPLRIIRPEIEPAETGQADRRGAHRAGFEGDVEIAFGKARRAQVSGARAQYQHLGMRGRVMV